VLLSARLGTSRLAGRAPSLSVVPLGRDVVPVTSVVDDSCRHDNCQHVHKLTRPMTPREGRSTTPVSDALRSLPGAAPKSNRRYGELACPLADLARATARFTACFGWSRPALWEGLRDGPGQLKDAREDALEHRHHPTDQLQIRFRLTHSQRTARDARATSVSSEATG
jgi:hypothetical protein